MAKHYVNNPEFLKCIIEYKKQCKLAEEHGKQKPRIPEYAGECIKLIAERMSKKFNFCSYSHIEEMREDGIENAITYFDNFDPEKYNNPFGYYSLIIWNAFIRRIAKEEKQQYIKLKNLNNQYMFDGLAHHDAGEDGFDLKYISLTDDFSNSFIENYEAKLHERKIKNKQKMIEKKKLAEEAEKLLDLDHE